MGDSAKVRLVRCPKCENLLPEMPDYSVYQCGGCGAVLRAKKSDPEGGRVSERSGEARDGVVSEKSDIFSAKSEGFPGKSGSGVENGDGMVSNSDGKSGAVADSHGDDPRGPVEKWDVENANKGRNDLANGDLECSADQLKSDVAKTNGLRNSDGFAKQKGLERGEFDGFGRIRRGDPEDMKFRSLNYAGEGTSRYYANDNIHRSATMMKNQNEASKINEVDHIRPHKEELLRRLDELKEQLSKSCDVNEKYKEKDPMDLRIIGRVSYADNDHWYPDHSSGFHRGSRQFYASDEHGIRPNHFDCYHEPYAPLQRSEMSRPNYHSSAQDLSHTHVYGYENPYGSRLYTRPLNSQQPKSHPHMPGHFLGPEPDPFEPHLCKNPADPFPCSCCQCYHKHCQVPSTAHRRYPLVSSKPVPCRLENHGPHTGSYDPKLHTRWPSDLNLIGGVASSRPHRSVPTNGRRRCHPMAGGAPFVTCHSCFELLELPKKVPEFDKCQWKIRCGGCSSVISFSMVDEKLVPVDTPPKQRFMDAFDSSGEILHDRPYDPHGGMRRDNAGFHYEDYDNSGFNSSKSEELQNHHLMSSSTSEDEVCDANGMPQEQFDYSSKYCAVNQCGKGNLSSRSDQERVLPSKNTTRQNSLKDSLATELDISLNDYSNTGVSQDNADTSGEEDLPKAKRGVDSFFAGIIKKSFRDFSKSSQTAENGKRSVFVNGHLIPDRSVKKAEKLAGPISPGQYWYDFKAGFWGVIGGPCLGIIPPHIEEFNYPMEQNCAGGNTGVLVNGRELHQNDLDLLASRGLPVTRNRSYIIEISGKVVDEESSEELDCLGKLAPTVEKFKHGFGMRVPKAVS